MARRLDAIIQTKAENVHDLPLLTNHLHTLRPSLRPFINLVNVAFEIFFFHDFSSIRMHSVAFVSV